MQKSQFVHYLIGLTVFIALAVSAEELRQDLLIADFEESSYGQWNVEGTAFGEGPAEGSLPSQMKVTGYLGHGLANSFHNGDGSVGVLTSAPFTIKRNFINFLIGGGGYTGETCMNLLVDNRKVRSATGSNTRPGGSEALVWHTWDVGDLQGRTAQLQVVDRRTGGWGHINVDQIVQSDQRAVSVFEKKLVIAGKYLLVPVKNGDSINQGTVFRLYKNDRAVRIFRVLLPENGGKADWTAFYPVEKFAGETLVLESRDPLSAQYTDAAEAICLSDTIPDADSDYSLPYRDQFHYSQHRGWNNDVNGLVYNNGTYHLYYQYNPFGIGWDNMHWGHATSTDLVHWTEQNIALYQNGLNDMIFSGGGFMDFNNTSGVSENGIVPQFAAFTSTGRGECLAYSLDEGNTFAEIPENPVVRHERDGRDPKVIWYEPGQKWIMAVYDRTVEIMDPPPLSETPKHKLHNSVAFYSSENLRKWTFESHFIHADRNAIHECPELFEIPVEDHPGETRWILYGVENRYFIGQFDGHRFVSESGPFDGETGLVRAAQMVSDAPQGRRIQIAWARGKAFYPHRWANQRFSQGFLLPKEVTLRETPGGLRLFFYPVKEIDGLRGEQRVSVDNPTVTEADRLLKTCSGKLLDVTMEYRLDPSAELKLRVNGQDVVLNESGSVRLLSDRTITEAFVNDGRQALSFRREEEMFDDSSCGISLSGGGRITKLFVYVMKSVW